MKKIDRLKQEKNKIDNEIAAIENGKMNQETIEKLLDVLKNKYDTKSISVVLDGDYLFEQECFSEEFSKALEKELEIELGRILQILEAE